MTDFKLKESADFAVFVENGFCSVVLKSLQHITFDLIKAKFFPNISSFYKKFLNKKRHRHVSVPLSLDLLNENKNFSHLKLIFI